jgi:hypothetical protein
MMKEAKDAEREKQVGVFSIYVCVFVFHSGQNRTTTRWNRLGVILIGDVGAVFCYSASEGGVVGV